MKTTVEKLSSNQVKIDFVVDAQAFEKGMQTAYNKLKGRISIPGFRRGHAPRQVIQMHYGPQVFYDDAFEAIFPDIYREAVEEHKLDPVDRPSVAEVSQIGQGQDLIFSATVYVRPEVTLGQYKGIPVQKQSVDVTEDDVNAELERARELSKANVLMGLESTQSRMSALGRGLLLQDQVLTTDQVIDAYNAVTAGDVRDLAQRLFRLPQASLSVVGRPAAEEDYRALLGQ